MLLAQQLILNVPAILLCTIIVTISIILSVVGILIMRHFIPHHRLKIHNDITAAIFAVMGVTYAVLLAFIVVVTWENFNRANLNVEKEANFLVDLYRDAKSFQEPFKQQIRTLISEYGETVVNEEWRMIK